MADGDSIFPELHQDTVSDATPSQGSVFPELHQQQSPGRTAPNPFLGNLAAFGSQALQGALSVPEAINTAASAPVDYAVDAMMGPPKKPYTTLAQNIRDITKADQLMKQYPVAGTLGDLVGSYFTPLPLPGLSTLPKLAGHVLRGGLGASAMGAANAINQGQGFGQAAAQGANNFLPGMVVGGALGTAGDKIARLLDEHKMSKAAELMQMETERQADEARRAFENQYNIAPSGEHQSVIGKAGEPYDPFKPPGAYREPTPYERLRGGSESVVTHYQPDITKKPFSPYDIGPEKGKAVVTHRIDEPQPKPYNPYDIRGGTQSVVTRRTDDPLYKTSSPYDTLHSGGRSVNARAERQSLEGRVEKGQPSDLSSESWRGWTHEASRPGTAGEFSQVSDGLNRKITFDKLRAKTEGARQQLAHELNLKMRNLPPKYTPEGWKKIQAALAKMTTARMERTSQPFVEMHISQAMPRDYHFTSKTVRGKFEEVERLRKETAAAEADYDEERKRLVGRVPFEEHIKFRHRGYNVSMFHTTQKTIKFDSPAEEAEYKAIQREANEAGPGEPDYSHAGFSEALANALKTNVDLKGQLEAWNVWDFVDKTFSRAAKAGRSSVASSIVGPLTTIFHVVNAVVQEARERGMEIKVSDLFPKVLNALKAKGLEKEIDPRWIRKLTLNMVNSDVVRSYDPEFAWTRDKYLAAREKLTLGTRDPNPEERELLNSMTPAEIRKTGLKGWTQRELEKEAAARELDQEYKKELQGRIAKLQEGGAEPGFAGNNELLKVLMQDMDRLAPRANADPMRGIGGKIVGGLYEANFLGNWRVSELHWWEMSTKQLSDSPLLTAHAVYNYATNPIARQYANALSGKGMQQRLLEGQDKFAIGKWWDKTVNDPIQKFIENKIPLGKVIWKLQTAEAPELVKTGASALLAAERVAKKMKYPGGVNTLMKDYLDTAQGKVIPRYREPLLAKAEIEILRDRNEAIMYSPPGPIQEMTVVQRNQQLGSMAMMLRGVITQARVLTGYADDLSFALSKRDVVAATDAVRKLVFAHVIIAFEAGVYTLPGYIWWILDACSPNTSAELRKLFHQVNATNPTDRESKEFGPKWVPVLEGGSFFLLSVAHQVAGTFGDIKTLHNDKDHRKLLYTTAQIMATAGVGRIGSQGTGNLMFLYRRMADAMKGKEKLQVYADEKGVQALLKPDGKRLGTKTFKMTRWEGISDWLLQGERLPKALYREKLEAKEDKKERRKTTEYIQKLPQALGF